MNIKNLIYLVLLFPALSWGQTFNVQVFPYTPTSGFLALFTDDFEGYSASGASLNGQGSWLAENGDMDVNDTGGDNRVSPNAAGNHASYYNQTFTDDQYSQAVMDDLAGLVKGGVTTNCQNDGGDYYIYYGSDAESKLARIVDGSATDLATGDAWSNTDIVKLVSHGDLLKCYKNGSLDTSIDSDGIVTDDSGDKLTGGWPGIGGNGNNIGIDIDDWEGGDYVE